MSRSRQRSSTVEPVMRSPAHRHHEVLGASFVREAGWEIPEAYADRAREKSNLAEGVGVADVTARGKIDVRGDVDAVLAAGADGLVVGRISDTWAVLLTEPGDVGARLPALEAASPEAAMVTDATHLYAGFALAGPGLAGLLERLTHLDPRAIPVGGAAGGPVAEVRGVLFRRDLPVETVEVYVGSELGRYVWETLLEEAETVGGGPVGWDALREAGWSPC